MFRGSVEGFAESPSCRARMEPPEHFGALFARFVVRWELHRRSKRRGSQCAAAPISRHPITRLMAQ
eukprot:6999208-Pyramimonas_sp.AAC.1